MPPPALVSDAGYLCVRERGSRGFPAKWKNVLLISKGQGITSDVDVLLCE